MLDSYENRKGYMLAFGLAANSIISVILGANHELLGYELSATVDREMKKVPFLGGEKYYTLDHVQTERFHYAPKRNKSVLIG